MIAFIIFSLPGQAWLLNKVHFLSLFTFTFHLIIDNVVINSLYLHFLQYLSLCTFSLASLGISCHLYVYIPSHFWKILSHFSLVYWSLDHWSWSLDLWVWTWPGPTWTQAWQHSSPDVDTEIQHWFRSGKWDPLSPHPWPGSSRW